MNPSNEHSPNTFGLRLLQTTDLHGYVLNFDYFQQKEVLDKGLSRAAPIIEILRYNGRYTGYRTLLFDCGDFLQGNPICDEMPHPNPMISAMNAMRYDAVALGNHDFSYGYSYLAEVLEQGKFPVVASNIETPKDYQIPFHERILKHVNLYNSNGEAAPVKIGIFSVLPPTTRKWEAGNLEAPLTCFGILERAQMHTKALREAGADVIVCLCHSGISSEPYHTEMENAALHIARDSDVDAILAGHAHLRFPGPDIAATDEVDPIRGTLCGVPTVMAGHFGSHIGHLDLDLVREADGRMRIIKSNAMLHKSVDSFDCPIMEIPQQIKDAHGATVSKMRAKIGNSQAPICSGMEQLCAGRTSALIAEAYLSAANNVLRSSPPNIPLIAMVPPYCAGGFGASSNFISIPAGPIEQRHLNLLYPFPNKISVLEATGALLREWLEQSASLLAYVPPGAQDIELLQGAAYMLDRAYGIEYEIDLSALPRYKYNGTICSTDSHRIGDIRDKNGDIITDDMPILITTTKFRHAGSAPITIPSRCRELQTAPLNAAEYVHQKIQVIRDAAILPEAWGPKFKPIENASVRFSASSETDIRNHPWANKITAIAPIEQGKPHLLRYNLSP